MLRPLREIREPKLGALTAGLQGCLVLMAFSKMTHSNHPWSVYPLGRAALAAGSAPLEEGGREGTRGSLPL